MKPPTLVLLLAVPALAYAALGPRYGGDLRVGVLDLPASLEPGAAQSVTERMIAGLVHETLLGTSTDGLLEPRLAAGWSSAAGGREWTLRLGGAACHDGRAASSADVVRSLRRFLRAASPAALQFAGALDGGAAFRTRVSEELPGIAAPDALRVVLRLQRPSPLSLLPLAAPAAAITGVGSTGCGPFEPSAYLPGRQLALLAFGDHIRGRPFLDRVVANVYPDPRALQAAFQAGTLDVIPGEGGVSAPVATLLLLLDGARPPFNHPDLRAAVSAAIDRVELVRRLLRGGDPAPALVSSALLPPLPAPETTAATRVTGAITMAVSTDVPPLVSQRIVAHLGALGLEVAVEPGTPEAAAHNVKAQARLLLFMPEVPEPGLALHELAQLAPVPAADAALTAADAEIDQDRRRVQLLRAEAALRSASLLVPLATVPVSFKLRHGAHGARVDLGGRLLLENAWLEP